MIKKQFFWYKLIMIIKFHKIILFCFYSLVIQACTSLTPVYQHRVQEKAFSHPDSAYITVAGESFNAGPLERKFFGEHYRDTRAIPVRVKYLNMDTSWGGLSFTKQSRNSNLLIQDKEGNSYQFRIIAGDPGLFFPQDPRASVKDTVPELVSSAYPYGDLIIPGLANAIGIHYTEPELVYISYPSSQAGNLGFIERLPRGETDMLGTSKMLEKLKSDQNNEIDREMYLKTRLFDLLVGDWERNVDQWQWSGTEKEYGMIFRPVPPNRDRAFTKFDGFISEIISKIRPDIQSFDAFISDPDKLSVSARSLDHKLLDQLSKNDWGRIVSEMKIALSDDVIENSVSRIPAEVYQQAGEEIISKLKSRREQLAAAADRYYHILEEKIPYNKYGMIPSVDYNGSDLVFLGLSYQIKTYTHLFNNLQSITGNYAPITGAYAFRYRGEFYSLLSANTDLIIKGSFNGHRYTFNYYGQGNSSLNIGDNIDYYRVNTNNASIAAYIQYRPAKAFRAGIGPGYEYLRVEKPGNSFVGSMTFPGIDDISRPSHYVTVRSFINIDFTDDPFYPRKGIRWKNEFNYFSETGSSRQNYVQLKSDLSFHLSPDLNFPVTAAFRFGGAVNLGNYKFFQANSLGSNTNLRGYRNNRFSGRSSVYQNTELRFKVSNLRNYTFAGKAGLFVFFDSGRVYSDLPETNRWHKGYGPGIWLNLYNKFMISSAYGLSKEGKYLTLKTGLTF